MPRPSGRDLSFLPSTPYVRIALDVHVLNGPPQGTVTVWETLLDGLPDRHEYVLLSFDPAETRRRFSQPWFEHRRIPVHFAPLRIALAYPALARMASCDVLHVNYFGPPVGARGLVVSMHDVLYLDFPELVPPARRAQFRMLGGLTARRAACVLAVSEYSRQRVAHHFGLDPARIHHVPNGLRREWLLPSEEAIAAAWRDIAPRLPRRFALSVGRLEQRKNHLEAARVASRLRRDGLVDGLVIVGADDFGGDALRRALAAEGLSEIVIHLPRVGLHALQAIYRNASALLYLSLAEGFGLPALEAMAMGTPIVAADRTAIPEVCGDAALLVDPDDREAVVAAARRVLDESAVVETLRARGLARAREFTTQRTVDGTLAVYERAAA
jgi:glycosyltransferase involved in cell wall biosynthesis